MTQKKLASFAFLIFLGMISIGCGPEPTPPPNPPQPPTPPPGHNYVDHLSPPIIDAPVYDCARTVLVKGYTVGAEVILYANGNEELAKGKPYFWYWPFTLTRALIEGDVVTAIQKVKGESSYPTRDPVIVARLPGYVLENKLGQPKIEPPLYDCQRAVSVKQLVEGCLTEVFTGTSNLIGQGYTPFQDTLVKTPPLVEGQDISAQQSFCSQQYKSPRSVPEPVLERPTSLPTPVVDESSLLPGSGSVAVDNLVLGALVDIYADQQRIGGGITPGGSVVFEVNPPIQDGPEYWAKQALCNVESSGPKTTAKGILDAPKLESPLCEGGKSASFLETKLNTTIRLYGDGKQVGQGAGSGGRVTLSLGDNLVLKAGEVISATQETDQLVSPPSVPVTVSGPMADPVITIENGHPFFQPESGEQAIPEPVYLRGVLTTAVYGPVFKVLMCGADKVDVKIIAPNEAWSETRSLTQTHHGFFEGGWDWQHSGWKIPDDIPVGKYRAVFSVTGSNGITTVEKLFYIIFNPDEVTASKTFSLSDGGEKGIYFGTGPGKDFGVTYALHPDDNRIFCLAILGKDCPSIPTNIQGKVTITGVNGETDPYIAAQKLLDVETPLFNYDIYNDHGSDVIHLLEKETAAQCYDDANLFTAILRSVGIPAHPVTGDAASEHSRAWFFDTWTEARLKGPLGEQWYVFHPHYDPGNGPDTRNIAGTTWGVAAEEDNDIIIAANGDWPAYALQSDDNYPDVEFAYFSCNDPNNPNWYEPKQDFQSQANWIDHLCEDGYWNPNNHWSCTPPGRYAIQILLERERYLVGAMLTSSVTVSNPTQDPISDVLMVNIVAHHPWSMAGKQILFEFA